MQAAGLQPGPPSPPGLGVRPERYLGAHLRAHRGARRRTLALRPRPLPPIIFLPPTVSRALFLQRTSEEVGGAG